MFLKQVTINHLAGIRLPVHCNGAIGLCEAVLRTVFVRQRGVEGGLLTEFYLLTASLPRAVPEDWQP